MDNTKIDIVPVHLTPSDIIVFAVFFIAVLIIFFTVIYLYRAHKIRTQYYNEFRECENEKKSFAARSLK